MENVKWNQLVESDTKDLLKNLKELSMDKSKVAFCEDFETVIGNLMFMFHEKFVKDQNYTDWYYSEFGIKELTDKIVKKMKVSK